MKNIIIIFFIIVLFCGCTAPQEQETVPDSTPAPMQPDKIHTKESIPPFEKEEREILPLPEKREITDAMELVDSIIVNYEILHFEEFEADFVIESMTMEKHEDGYLFTSINVKQPMLNMNKFKKPIKDYFSTPDNDYAVLLRFKSDEIKDLYFQVSGITLKFYEGIYPATDVSGGGEAPMINEDWNNYIYEPGEWAYAFLTSTKYGEKTCYIWAENDISNYNFFTAYTDDNVNASNNNFDFTFGFEETKSGEKLIISDIWLYSYEGLKR